MTAKIFRFVRHPQVQAFADLGWIGHRSLEGTHHGEWSRLMEWPLETPPIEPEVHEVPLAG